MERYFSKSRLSSNPLDAPGHRALSLLHLPRLRKLYLGYNGLDADGLAALASAPWLTQLAELHIDQFAFFRSLQKMPRPFGGEPVQSRQSMSDAIKDDAGVFGRLRRLGCVVDALANITDPFDNDEPGSGPEWGSGDELGSGDESGSDPGDT